MPYNAAVYIGAGAVLAVIAAVAIRAWLKRRPSPEELERGRRLAINRSGKMADGTILDISATEIAYSYSVRGVEYSATQDVTALHDKIPAGGFAMVGAAGVKYDPRNPANSIVVCEDWSGLRNAGEVRH